MTSAERQKTLRLVREVRRMRVLLDRAQKAAALIKAETPREYRSQREAWER